MSKSLFDAIQINNLTIKNRFVRSASWEGLCDDDGKVTPPLVDMYRDLASGGTGLIISGYSYVRNDGKQLPGKMGICDDEQIPGLKELTDAAHQEDSKIFCQLVHAGGQTTSKVIGSQPLVPSVTDYAGYQDTPREMTTAEVKEIIAAFGEAAARAVQAGFDGVQLHGAHGYLINQFLSPLCNQRTDEYGGNLENRMKFLEEVYSSVRCAVGEGYPVAIKLTLADHLDGGLTEEDGVIIAKRLNELGIDAIEVSSGTAVSGVLTPVRTKIDTLEKEAYNAELAALVKKAVDVPVITVGGLRSGKILQQLLDSNAADMMSFSRPLIKEPDLPKKWQEKASYVASCISCNGCFRPGLKGEGIRCVINQ